MRKVVEGTVYHEGGYVTAFFVGKVGPGFYGPKTVNDVLNAVLGEFEGRKVEVSIKDLGPDREWRR